MNLANGLRETSGKSNKIPTSGAFILPDLTLEAVLLLFGIGIHPNRLTSTKFIENLCCDKGTPERFYK